MNVITRVLTATGAPALLGVEPVLLSVPVPALLCVLVAVLEPAASGAESAPAHPPAASAIRTTIRTPIARARTAGCASAQVDAEEVAILGGEVALV
jgi:hypothetical protein